MVDGLFFCSTQATDEGMPHLYKQERKRLTLMQRRLSQTHAVLGRVIPRGWVLVSVMKGRILLGLSVSAPHVCCQIN